MQIEEACWRRRQEHTANRQPEFLMSKSVAPYQHTYSLRSKSISPCKHTSAQSKELPKTYDISGLTEGVRKIDVSGHNQIEIPSKNDVSKCSLKSITPETLQSETASLSNQSKLAMKAVDLYLTQLTEIHKSGWKVATRSKSDGINVLVEPQHQTHLVENQVKNYGVLQVLKMIDDCATEISTLRKFLISGVLSKSRVLDVERAGLALVNHALGLQLYNAALHLLTVSHTTLQSLLCTNAISMPSAITPSRPNPSPAGPISCDAWADHSVVLTFSLYDIDLNFESNLEKVSLLATSIAQGFRAFLNSGSDPPRSLSQKPPKSSQQLLLRQSIEIRAKLCIKAMASPMSLHRWYKFLDTQDSPGLKSKLSVKILAAARSSYTTLITACTRWGDLLDPEVLFQLQKSATLWFMACQTQSSEFSAVDHLMDHARRTILKYARSFPNDQSDAAEHAKAYIMEIIQTIPASRHGSCPAKAGWIGLCQTVIHLAGKAGDLNFIDDLTLHLKNDHASPQQYLSAKCETSGKKQIDFVWLKLAATGAALDNFNKFQEAVAIPSGGFSVIKPDVKTKDLPFISQAIEIIEDALVQRTIECAHVWTLEETLYTLMNLKFIRCVLVSRKFDTSNEIAALIDFASSITLRRKMLDIVPIKLSLAGLPKTRLSVSPSTSKADTSTGSPVFLSMQQYWLQVQCHHTSDAENPATYRPILNMPSDWRVITLHMSQDSDSLFLVQHNSLIEPLVVKLPITRRRRKGFSFELSDALQELKIIVSSSNANTQRAEQVSGRTDKAIWCEERVELEKRMRRLVENIENHWLGGFKGFLRSSNSVKKPKALRTVLEKIFHKHPTCLKGQTTQSCTLDDHVFNAFVSLPVDCPDEDLQDIIRFGMAYHQIHEAVDTDDSFSSLQVFCQLREAQKNTLKPHSKQVSSKQHLFLILDRNLQVFPWEVLPHLNGHSISRIPSLSFLRDRLLAMDQKTAYPTSIQTELCKPSTSSFTINPSRTTYILNPSSDLISTQAQFETWLESNPSWTGIKNRSPTSDEVRQALMLSELMLYFGHSGGEQYLRLDDIMLLPRCAVTMLWGCSSGMLSDQCCFDTTGTPYAYMLAGCPSLLANLWDVTDKDIDRLAMDLFKRTGLFPSDDPCCEPVSLTQALAEARSICRFRYLNGAAPVVYGLPVKFGSVDK